MLTIFRVLIGRVFCHVLACLIRASWTTGRLCGWPATPRRKAKVRGSRTSFFLSSAAFCCFGWFLRLNWTLWGFLVCLRLLGGQEASVQHGPVRGDLADRGDNHPVGAQALQRQRQGRRGSLILRRGLTYLCVRGGLRRWQMRLTLSETWDAHNNSCCMLVLVLDNEPRTLLSSFLRN